MSFTNTKSLYIITAGLALVLHSYMSVKHASFESTVDLWLKSCKVDVWPSKYIDHHVRPYTQVWPSYFSLYQVTKCSHSHFFGNMAYYANHWISASKS